MQENSVDFKEIKSNLALRHRICAVFLADTQGFAAFFTIQLKLAFAGDEAAIACIDSYLEPTDQELGGLGLPESEWGSLRKCTDSGFLVIVTANDEASRTPPPSAE